MCARANGMLKDDIGRTTCSFGMQLKRIAEWLVNDARHNAEFSYYPEISRKTWRHAQERLELGMAELISFNVGASMTMWEELKGATAAEKKKSLQSRVYLSIRNDPAKASSTLSKPLSFDDLVVCCMFVPVHDSPSSMACMHMHT